MDVLLIGGGFGLVGFLLGRVAKGFFQWVLIPLAILVFVVLAVLGLVGAASPTVALSAIYGALSGFSLFVAEVSGAWVLAAAWLAIPFFIGFTWAVFFRR